MTNNTDNPAPPTLAYLWRQGVGHQYASVLKALADGALAERFTIAPAFLLADGRRIECWHLAISEGEALAAIIAAAAVKNDRVRADLYGALTGPLRVPGADLSRFAAALVEDMTETERATQGNRAKKREAAA